MSTVLLHDLSGLEGTLHLDVVVHSSIGAGLAGQSHLRFVVGGGDGDVVDLGEAQTDVPECFVFGLGEDDVEVDGAQDADHHRYQEGIGLQRLLGRTRKHTERGVRRWRKR